MDDFLKYLDFEDPIAVLNQWIKNAKEHPKIKEPSAMTFCTVSAEASPSIRVVLCKEITKAGELVFYTNSKSKKALDLKQNQACACHFYWDPLFRQISIRGTARKTERKKTLAYWKTRPRASQLSQWASRQSGGVLNRGALTKTVGKAEKFFKNKEVACPKHWSGYFVKIDEIEFFIGRRSRLHDRFLFFRQKDSWGRKRLFP